ncbi:TolC family protein [Sulfurimonas sp.]
MKIFLSISAFILLTGCGGKNISYDEAVESTIKKENLNQPQKFKSVVDNGKINKGWIKDLNDPQLEKLLDESLQNNRQIRALQAQVQRSNALVKQAASQLKPTVGIGAEYSSKNALGFDEIYGGGLTASWEADVWGRLDASVSSVTQSAAATQSDYEFARQSLVASTAKAWYMSTTSKLQKNYAKSVMDIKEKVLKVVNAKYDVGQVGMRDVHLAKADLLKSKDAYSKAQAAYENSQRGLELLLGRYPSAEVESADKLISITTSIPSGIPSELLSRRPDIVAAEQRVAAAFYKQREAELLHLPRFTFSIGASVNNLTNAIANLGAGVFAPLYTGGAIEAEVEVANAVQKQSIELYAQKALEAFKEVETLLSLEEKLQDQESYLKDIVKENTKALEMTMTLFEVGKIDYLEVSQIDSRLIGSEIALLDISNKRVFNRISLYLALGGGFE